MRNWREIAENWSNFIKTPVGKAFLYYQSTYANYLDAQATLSLQSNDPNDPHVRELHRISEKALELFVKEVEILLNNQQTPPETVQPEALEPDRNS